MGTVESLSKCKVLKDSDARLDISASITGRRRKIQHGRGIGHGAEERAWGHPDFASETSSQDLHDLDVERHAVADESWALLALAVNQENTSSGSMPSLLARSSEMPCALNADGSCPRTWCSWSWLYQRKKELDFIAQVVEGFGAKLDQVRLEWVCEFKVITREVCGLGVKCEVHGASFLG